MYRDAIRLRPHYAVPKYGYGELLFRQNQFTEARSILEEAVREDSSSETILTLLGLTYARTGDVGKSAAIGDTLLAKNRDTPAGHLVYIEVGLQSGDTGLARSHYDSFLQTGQDRTDYESVRNLYRFLRNDEE